MTVHCTAITAPTYNFKTVLPDTDGQRMERKAVGRYWVPWSKETLVKEYSFVLEARYFLSTCKMERILSK